MRVRRFRRGAVALVLVFVLAFPGLAAAGSGTRYTVRSGDTLGSIAQAYGVTASAIMHANGLTDPDFIWAGQTLIIPTGSGGSGNSAAAGSSSSSSSSGSYTVKSGDTLGAIANRYNTTAAAIARTNGLSSPDRIYTGMKLRIPGSSGSTSTKAAAAPKASAAPKSSGTGTRFVASISQQHCWVYQGSTVVHSWNCSTGRAGSPTVPGTYRVQSKIPRGYGAAWNFWLPYWLGIYWAGSTENGIHGFPYDRGTGVKVWTSRIGTPITYGCVMLADPQAKILYDMAWIGMPVIITP